LKNNLDDTLSRHFEIVASGVPEGLHLPTFGAIRGPAANNLMALGWMTDQILQKYM
jgi:hypothetical protein